MSRARFVVLAVAVGSCSLAALAGADQAAAACVMPWFEHDSGTVTRGQLIQVSGRSFGDACNDTLPQRPGVRPLGDPLQGIEIRVVQGEHDVLVGRGNAETDYTFRAQVVVPVNLDPGEARLLVHVPGPRVANPPPWANGFDAQNRTSTRLNISDDPPALAETATVATFGPASTEPVPPVRALNGSPARSSASSSRAWVAAASGAAVGAAVRLLLRRRRRRRRAA